MSAVTRFFFRPTYLQQTPWSIIQWWEVRRPTYNLVVGAAGLLTLTTLALVAGPPDQFPHELFDLIVVYAIMANLFYCLGPALDFLVHRRLGPDYSAVGPALFRYGFVFAVGLTLLPIPLILAAGVARLFFLL
jgi:hypothetical protein